MLTGFASPEQIRRTGQNRLTAWLRAHKVRGSAAVAPRAVNAAKAPTIVLPGQDLTAGIITELATAILVLDNRLKELDARIEELFSRRPQAAIITSIPGFGPFLGACLLVNAADLRAFPSAGHLAAAAGLVPPPNDFGRRIGNLHRPSRYSRPFRHVFYLSAQTGMMRSGPNRDYYLKKPARGATHTLAVIAGPRTHRRPLVASARQPHLDRHTTNDHASRLTTTLRFPMTRYGPVGDLGGPIADHDHLIDEPVCARRDHDEVLGGSGQTGVLVALHVSARPGLEIQFLVDR